MLLEESALMHLSIETLADFHSCQACSKNVVQSLNYPASRFLSLNYPGATCRISFPWRNLLIFHTSGLKGEVKYASNTLNKKCQKHIPLASFVVFANVTLLYLEEENVIFSLGRFRMNWRMCLECVSKLLMTIGRPVYSKQFQATSIKICTRLLLVFNK
jgi:hypothetical protein